MMQVKFKRGRSRVVVIFPFFRIAIKLPIIHLLVAMRAVYYCIKSDKCWQYLQQDWGWSVEQHIGFKGHLFLGIVANWNEFVFYQKTRDPFLQPTYFSFFGLFNIQRVDESYLLNDEDLYHQLFKLTDGEVQNDSHHFENPHNFCFCDGSLRMLDYGSSKTRRIIAQYGTKIVDLFNPKYSWEEE